MSDEGARARLTLILILTVAAFGPGAPAVAVAVATDTPWTRTTTENFVVFSDAENETARALSHDLELLHAVLESLNPALDTESPVPTYVFIFRDGEAFLPYKLRVNGRPAPIAGYFLSHPHANFVAVAADARGGASRIIYHEYLHYFVRHNLPRVPLWLNEGLAEFYSTFRLNGDEVEIGREVARHTEWLRTNDLMPMRRFLDTDASSRIYNEEKRQGAFYAQSWALVHMFLAADDSDRSALDAYLGRLEAGDDPTRALAESFDVRLGDLEARLSDYVRRPVFNFFRQSLDGIEPADVLRTVVMSSSEVLYQLGYLLAHHDPVRIREADEHFRRSQRLDRGYAPARLGQGYLQHLRQDFEAAHFFYEEALTLDGNDFLSHFLSAANLLEWNEALRDLADPDDESAAPRSDGTSSRTVETARASFARSIELRPDFGEAWAGLGSTYVGDARPTEEGLGPLRRARDLLPQRPDITYNLAILAARLGRTDEANDLVERVLVSQADPEVVQQAREGLLRVELQAAEALLSDGDLEAGLEVIDSVIVRTEDSELFAQLSDKADEARAVLNSRHYRGLFEEAMELARESRYDDAVSTLETIVRETHDPGLRRVARENLRQFRRLHQPAAWREP